MRVSTYLSQWLNTHNNLAPRTRDSYAATIRLHIAPAIGKRKLLKLKPGHVSDMLTAIMAKGHSRTAELCYAILHAALRAAVLRGLIPASPMDQVARPAHQPCHYPHLDQDQIPRYLAAVEGDRLALAWLLALLCGLRRGELCGLRWEAVDLHAMQIHITAQRVTLANGHTIDTPPKSAAGRRIVPIPAALLPLLAVSQQPTGYVVTRTDGQPYTPSGLDHAHRTMIRRAGLPRVPPHGLRHTMATIAVTSGVHMRVLQALLGHSSYQITANTYAHVDQRAAMSAIDSIAATMIQS
ncbi:MAG: tyrosine-type recombinase/integrase [Clostridia bacterium]|nr:tyrosine-type recombinase/integrase [Clostridia bacterium]